MSQDMTVDEALLYADNARDNGWGTTLDDALGVLAAEVRRQHAELNRRAEVAERAIQAMNENADRGERAEAELRRLQECER